MSDTINVTIEGQNIVPVTIQSTPSIPVTITPNVTIPVKITGNGPRGIPGRGVENIIYNSDENNFNIIYTDGTVAITDHLNLPSADYENLVNLPLLNDREIIGNKTFEDFGLIALTDSELEELLI